MGLSGLSLEREDAKVVVRVRGPCGAGSGGAVVVVVVGCRHTAYRGRSTEHRVGKDPSEFLRLIQASPVATISDSFQRKGTSLQISRICCIPPCGTT